MNLSIASIRYTFLASLLMLLAACGGGGGGGGGGSPPPPASSAPSNTWDLMVWDQGNWG